MCNSVIEHERGLRLGTHLDTLYGGKNKMRRLLRDKHREQDGKCIWCGIDTILWWTITTAEFEEIGVNRMATREHMIPQSLGGIDKDNIACACHECNWARGAISENQFKWVTATPERRAKFIEKKFGKTRRKKKASYVAKYTKLMNRRTEKKEYNLNHHMIEHLMKISKKHKNAQMVEWHKANKVKKSNARSRRKIRKMEERNRRDAMVVEQIGFFKRIVNRLMGDRNAKSNTITA